MSASPDRMARLLRRTESVPASTSPFPGVGSALFRGPLLEASATAAVLTVPGVARYGVSVDDGVQVTVEPSATEADARCFLRGPVRALDLLLHGVFSLRASAVLVDGGAVVICGAAATGKSVLAAALAARGHTVLADRVAPVVFTPGGPVVWPTDACVQLWPPAAKVLGLDRRGAEIIRPALAKRAHRTGAGHEPRRPAAPGRGAHDPRRRHRLHAGARHRRPAPHAGAAAQPAARHGR